MFEIGYSFRHGRLIESAENTEILQRRGLLNSSVHKDIQQKLKTAEVIISSSFGPFRMMKKACCLILFLLVVAMLVTSLYALKLKSQPLKHHGGSSRALSHGGKHWRFWQCMVDGKTANKTHAELHCDFKPWNRTHENLYPFFGPKPRNSENFVDFDQNFTYSNFSYPDYNYTYNYTNGSFGDNYLSSSNFTNPSNSSTFDKTSMNVTSSPLSHHRFSSYLSSSNSFRMLESFNGDHFDHENSQELAWGHHGHHRPHPLFLTINDHPFLLFRPCPIPPCVRKLILCLAMSLNNCIIILLVIICCARRHHKRSAEKIEAFLNENGDNSHFFRVNRKGRRLEVKVFIQGKDAALNYPELSMRRDPIEGKKDKKVKYILVEENEREVEAAPLNLREQFSMKN